MVVLSPGGGENAPEADCTRADTALEEGLQPRGASSRDNRATRDSNDRQGYPDASENPVCIDVRRIYRRHEQVPGKGGGHGRTSPDEQPESFGSGEPDRAHILTVARRRSPASLPARLPTVRRTQPPPGHDPDGDSRSRNRPIGGTQEPRRNLIHLAYDRDVNADGDSRSQRPPATDGETENQPTKNEERIEHDC